MNRIINQKMLTMVFLLACLACITSFGFILYWLLCPYKTIEFKQQPYPVLNLNKTVSQGEHLRYTIDYCKYIPTIPTVSKFFVDGVIFETPESLGISELGCHIVTGDIYIPKAIPDGNYRVKIIARYKLNPIRTEEVLNWTEPFIVKQEKK